MVWTSGQKLGKAVWKFWTYSQKPGKQVGSWNILSVSFGFPVRLLEMPSGNSERQVGFVEFLTVDLTSRHGWIPRKPDGRRVQSDGEPKDAGRIRHWSAKAAQCHLYFFKGLDSLRLLYFSKYRFLRLTLSSCRLARIWLMTFSNRGEGQFLAGTYAA